MMKGKITANQEAIIELEVIGVTRPEKIEAVIDTGFDGELSLPSDFIRHLKLQRIGEMPVILGDGSTVDLDVYLAKVLWHGALHEVDVLRTDGDALIGMSLLSGSRLTLDIVTDGDVTITALPSRNRG